MAYSDREIRALRAIIEACLPPAAKGGAIVERLTRHVHNDNCPSWNGHPTHAPAYCPNREDRP